MDTVVISLMGTGISIDKVSEILGVGFYRTTE